MSGLNPAQFKALVIRPALAALDLPNPGPAANLLLGTALTESGLEYLHQIGGPALGVYQIEPATHEDVWANFIWWRGEIGRRMVALDAPNRPTHERLIFDLRYATAIARLIFYRSPIAMPAGDDAAAFAAFHKAAFNTSLGATDPSASVEHFRRAVAA